MGLFRYCTGLIDASKLILPATILKERCYADMFRDCTNLVISPELPAINFAFRCHADMFHACTNLKIGPSCIGNDESVMQSQSCVSMFSQCSNLVVAPKLPSRTLSEECYNYMFWECSSLEKAPVLPAKTVPYNNPYNQMFYHCSKLKYVMCLAETISETSNRLWLDGVNSKGIFVKKSSTSWKKGSSGIPDGWFIKKTKQ